MSDSLSANHSVIPPTPMSEAMENICFRSLLLQSSIKCTTPRGHPPTKNSTMPSGMPGENDLDPVLEGLAKLIADGAGAL